MDTRKVGSGSAATTVKENLEIVGDQSNGGQLATPEQMKELKRLIKFTASDCSSCERTIYDRAFPPPYIRSCKKTLWALQRLLKGGKGGSERPPLTKATAARISSWIQEANDYIQAVSDAQQEYEEVESDAVSDYDSHLDDVPDEFNPKEMAMHLIGG